jgi:hypothetical protein
MNKSTKIISLSAAILALCGITYGTMYTYTKNALNAGGSFQVSGFHLYLDGVVIDELKTDQLTFTKLYLHGYPWNIGTMNADYISTERLIVNSKNLFSSPIYWPFKDSMPLTIKNVEMNTEFMGQKFQFIGSLKQSEETPLLLGFESTTKELALMGQSEIRVKDRHIKMIDLEFHDASLSQPNLTFKRSAGWASLSYEKGWNIIGEIDSGFTQIKEQPLFDGTLKINGPVQNPNITLAAKDKINDPIILNKNNKGFFISINDKNLPVKGNTLDIQTIENMAIVLHKHDKFMLAKLEKQKLPPIEEQPVLKASVKPVKKIPTKNKKDPAPIQKQAPVIQASIPDPAPPVIQPVSLPQVSFYDLIQNTIFSGFYYGKPLTLMQVPCTNTLETSCWTARGKKGSFTYNPEVLPQYLLRIRNYEQVKQLKDVLLNMQLRSIVIHGQGQQAREMILKGKTAEGREAYIQLSVLDLE